MNASELRLVDVVVRHHDADRLALDRIDLVVPAGTTLAVLGPSGCGKTTMLRAIAGLVVPTSGRIVLGGDDITERPTHQRGIGLVFQDHALFPHRDVGANVAFGLRMQGLDRPARTRRVSSMLDLVGLPGYERRRVATLSGGEAQRVALARALAPGPRVLLLDEPLGSLDRPTRERLLGELRRLLDGRTAVLVTHDRDEAAALGDQVAVLREGRVARIGTVDDVWADPGDDWVAGFLGLG